MGSLKLKKKFLKLETWSLSHYSIHTLLLARQSWQFVAQVPAPLHPKCNTPTESNIQ